MTISILSLPTVKHLKEFSLVCVFIFIGGIIHFFTEINSWNIKYVTELYGDIFINKTLNKYFLYYSLIFFGTYIMLLVVEKYWYLD